MLGSRPKNLRPRTTGLRLGGGACAGAPPESLCARSLALESQFEIRRLILSERVGGERGKLLTPSKIRCLAGRACYVCEPKV